MYFSKIIRIGLSLLLLGMNLPTVSTGSQKYAPLVGRWHIELKIDGRDHHFEFETDGQGVYGLGTGYFILPANNSRSSEYPAAWSNIDPQKIGITGEIMLPGERTTQPETLTLRTTLAPGREIKGDAIILDESQSIRRGSFMMKRLLGPEDIRRKKT